MESMDPADATRLDVASCSKTATGEVVREEDVRFPRADAFDYVAPWSQIVKEMKRESSERRHVTESSELRRKSFDPDAVDRFRHPRVRSRRHVDPHLVPEHAE